MFNTTNFLVNMSSISTLTTIIISLLIIIGAIAVLTILPHIIFFSIDLIGEWLDHKRANNKE